MSISHFQPSGSLLPPTYWTQVPLLPQISPAWKTNSFKKDSSRQGNFGRKKFKTFNPMVYENDENIPLSPILTQEDVVFEEFTRRKQLGSIIAFLSATSVLMPLLTAAYLPFELINPNLFLAKSLVLLTIPLAVTSLGRRRRRSVSLDEDHENDDQQDLQSALDRWEKSLIIIQRQVEEYSPQNKTLSVPKMPIFSLPSFLQLRNNNTNTSKIVEPPVESKDQQCLQRIACEGLANSLPQIFIRSVWKQQDEDVGTGTKDGGGSSKSRTMIRFKNAKNKVRMNKRKNLAKYALGKIRPELGGKFGNKQNNSSFPENPPKDLSKGWFLPPQNRTMTRTKVKNSTTTTTTTSTTPTSLFAIKLKHQIETIVQSHSSTTESPQGNRTETSSSVPTQTTPPQNPCARFKCAFML